MAFLRSAAAALIGAFLGLSVAACDDEEPAVDCGAVADELGSASPGGTVRVGSCTITGDLMVPEGVTLVGAGPGETTVDGSVRLEAGAALEGIEVRPAIGAAVTATGGSVRLANVRLTGSVTPETSTEVPPMPSSTEWATHGLYLESAAATLDDVTIHGFARFGVLAIDSELVWVGGAASENLGVGLMATGGSVELDGVELCRTLQGIQPLPAYGAVFAGGVDVTTTGTTLCDNEGFGALHDGADAVHVDLVGGGNSEPALWAQRSPSFDLSGTGTVLSQNRIAALVLVDTPVASVRDAQIDDSELARRLVAGFGDVEAGDGIHLVGASTESTRFEGLSLSGNQRVGVLIDLDGGATVDDATLADITVEATGEAYGVIAQTPEGRIASDGWDSAVTRLGDTLVNDQSFTGRLDVVGIVGPMYLPPVE